MPVRRRYHFHTPGLVYVFITILTALGAFNSQNNLLFWAFGFALAVLLVSGLISGQMLMGIRAERTAPDRAIVGEPLHLSYRITNRSRLVPAFAIGVSEHNPPSTPPPPRRRPFGRRPQIPPRAFTFLVHLGPRETIDLSAKLTPARRGMLALSDFSLETTFPFGIVRKSLLFRQPRTILVRPRPVPPPPERLSRRRAGVAAAASSAARPGVGEEFFTLREYVPGDTPRSIAWRATARAGALLVRQNTLPVPRRLLLLLRLDLGAGEEANEAAISLAAGVLSAAAQAGYELGMSVPLCAIERRPSAGRAAMGRLLDDLALIDLASLPPRPAPIPAAASRSTLVVAVHAGDVDGSFGPHGTVHLSAPAPHDLPTADAPAASVNGDLHAPGNTALQHGHSAAKEGSR